MAESNGPHGILRAASSHAGSSHIKWDEATIAEHDKDRGTRMKIDEPKTPYRAGHSADVGTPLY